MTGNDPNQFNYYWLVLVMLKDVVLGLVGGLIAYVFSYSKAERSGTEAMVFKVSSMIINMILGAFVGFVCGTLLPVDTVGRDAIVALSGVTSYNILLLVESRFANWVFEKFIAKSDKKGKE